METTTTSSFWFILSACFGGFIVLVGILMEVLSEKKWFKIINDFRRCESVKHWGEILLIIGVAIEVVVAGSAAKDEWQTRQMAIKNAPENVPIKSFNLEASLMIFDPSRSDDNPYNKLSPQDVSDMATFGSYCKLKKIDGSDFAVLECKKFTDSDVVVSLDGNSVSNTVLYSMSFGWPGTGVSAMLASEINNAEISTKTFDKKIKGIVFRVPGSGVRLKILSGSCVLTINGSIQRNFLIPAHLNEMFQINTNHL
jgi:hypothetical protein